VLSMMLFTASTLCWLYLEGKLKGFFAAMQIIGKMTLTNYMMQNIIGMLLFSGFGLGLGFTGKMHFGLYLLLALVVYIIQIYWSRWWLSKYNYGPAEWLWRQLSYGKRLPLTRKQETNLEIFARAVGELPKKYPDYFNNHQANIDPRDPDADFIVYYNGYIQYVRFAPFSTLPDNIRDEIKHIYHDIYGKTDSRTGTDFSPYT
jgi:4-amino-4-deoxy-L-arabinose transferase-like glycosyltransferase